MMKKKTAAHSLRPGFTLIELMVAVSIIGVLATTGSVSYQFARALARDARRAADIRTIGNAIEVYFEQNGTYPEAGPDGLVLGSESAKMISDAGITPFGGERGLIYLQNVPSNPPPRGALYLYRSLSRDGSVCFAGCSKYAVAFELETPTGTLAPGPHLLTDEGILGPETGAAGSKFSAFARYLPSQFGATFEAAREVAGKAREAAARPEVQTVNRVVVAPASVLGGAASLAAALGAAVPLGSLGNLAFFFFAQPFLLFSRRRSRRWGVVYHAGTKVPVDLATVRLIEAKSGKIVATKVTDKDGRFAFAPQAGEYRLEAAKPGFLFPAPSLAGVSDDGAYADIYHGTLLHVQGGGEALAVNVPLEPEQAPPADARELLSAANKRALRKAAALAGPVLSAAALAITPSLGMLLLFLIQAFFYRLFRRLAEPPAPKTYGVVHDLDTRKPIAGAVVRVVSLPYHKVLETRLTDAQGRYAFMVGGGKYYLTALKPGYQKTETDSLDFGRNAQPAWIASNLPMRRMPPRAG